MSSPHATDHSIRRTIYLVRHALALDRDDWCEPDLLRPLTPKGHQQAERIRDILATRPISRITSSPAVRCVKTVEPLAKRLHLRVEQEPHLMEGNSIHLPDGDGEFVLCAHGDNIPSLLEQLKVDAGKCRKGSIWSLRFDLGGRLRGAEYQET